MEKIIVHTREEWKASIKKHNILKQLMLLNNKAWTAYEILNEWTYVFIDNFEMEYE
jgi:hypothetical protein